MKRLIVLLALLVSGMNLSSQEQNMFALNDLQMPTSPAFILLDVAPTVIERPKTTKAFSASILNSVFENNGIPENYAIDFAPYWYFKHKRLDVLNYWGIKQDIDGVGQKYFSQARFGNISFATVKSRIEIDSVGATKPLNNIAVGFRTTLIQVREVNDKNQLSNLNKNYISRLSELMQNPDLKPEDLINAIVSDPLLTNYIEEIKSILGRKPLFAIDLAAAGSWSFDNYNFSTIQTNRLGVWVTLNYSKCLNNRKNAFKENFINIYGIARILSDDYYLGEDGTYANSSSFDGGGKIEIEFDKLAFSYEYLYRVNINSGGDNSYRSSGLMQYRATDQILITAAFGKNFGVNNNLITQIGINWGLNNKEQNIVID